MTITNRVTRRSRVRSTAPIFAGILIALTIAGCSNNGYSADQEKQMQATAAAARDPSKLSPQAIKDRSDFIAKMRGSLPGAPQGRPDTPPPAQ